MQAKRKSTDRDWVGLAGQILEDPENKKEAETATEIEAVIRREQILQQISYETVNGQPIFINLDPKKAQEERLFARKMFEYFMKKKIASSGLDSTQKTMLLDLLDNNSYEGLPKSIDEKLKNTGYIKAKADSFILEIRALIIGVGHLLDRLKTGLLSKKLPSQATVIEEKHTETLTAPPLPPRRPVKPTSTGDLKTAMSIPATPSRTASPPSPVARPLTGAGAAKPQRSTTAPVQKKEQSRPLPAIPPAKKQENIAPQGSSVRSKIDFFKQLEQQRTTPIQPTARTPHRPK